MEPVVVFANNSSQFLEDLMKAQGVEKKSEWHNNNATLSQHAYVIDADNEKIISKIFSELFEYNQKSGEPPLVAVPVAGWDFERSPISTHCSFISRWTRKDRLIKEYAQSFSLSSWTTGKNADIILRTSKAMQQMYLFRDGNDYFFRVTAGVRVTDADEYLLEKGFALPPNMPTLHVASLVGTAANGCYGPARDYGPMTTNIVEMKVIDPLGKFLTLSEKENADLFAVLRDCHMGSGFYVSEMTLKNIEPKFMMKRRNVLFKDVEDFKMGMGAQNRINDEHFAAMYIPVDIHEKGNHYPRIRVTTMKRTSEAPTKLTKRRDQRDLSDYLNLITTEAGEPLINQIVEIEELREFFPLILKAGALKTYGSEKETEEIDWSPYMYHMFRTYTDLPLADYNWLIQVESADQARDLLGTLFELVENKLKHYAAEHKYPLFNAFSRYLKGICYPEGQGGVTCTATDRENQSVLSFELLTYTALAETPAFKSLVDEVVAYLNKHGFKFTYHPGKTWPDDVKKLSDVFHDTIGRKRLENFKGAIIKLHRGIENIRFSPLLTPQKKAWLGFDAGVEAKPVVQEGLMKAQKIYDKNDKQQALVKIRQLAIEQKHLEFRNKAEKLLKN